MKFLSLIATLVSYFLIHFICKSLAYNALGKSKSFKNPMTNDKGVFLQLRNEFEFLAKTIYTNFSTGMGVTAKSYFQLILQQILNDMRSNLTCFCQYNLKNEGFQILKNDVEMPFSFLSCKNTFLKGKQKLPQKLYIFILSKLNIFSNLKNNVYLRYVK